MRKWNYFTTSTLAGLSYLQNFLSCKYKTREKKNHSTKKSKWWIAWGDDTIRSTSNSWLTKKRWQNESAFDSFLRFNNFFFSFFVHKKNVEMSDDQRSLLAWQKGIKVIWEWNIFQYRLSSFASVIVLDNNKLVYQSQVSGLRSHIEHARWIVKKKCWKKFSTIILHVVKRFFRLKFPAARRSMCLVCLVSLHNHTTLFLRPFFNVDIFSSARSIVHIRT